MSTMDHAPKYGMYTDAGDERVAEIVQAVLALPDLSFEEMHAEAVERMLKLSDEEGCEEAMDTAVRDAVWEALSLEITT